MLIFGKKTIPNALLIFLSLNKVFASCSKDDDTSISDSNKEVNEETRYHVKYEIKPTGGYQYIMSGLFHLIRRKERLLLVVHVPCLF